MVEHFFSCWAFLCIKVHLTSNFFFVAIKKIFCSRSLWWKSNGLTLFPQCSVDFQISENMHHFGSLQSLQEIESMCSILSFHYASFFELKDIHVDDWLSLYFIKIVAKTGRLENKIWRSIPKATNGASISTNRIY